MMHFYDKDIHEDGPDTFNLIDDRIKIMLGASDNLFHFFTDTLAPIVEVFMNSPREILDRAIFVIDISSDRLGDNKFAEILGYVLNSIDMPYMFLQSKLITHININNFILPSQSTIPASAANLEPYIRSFADTGTQTPSRRVYLSRRADVNRNPDQRVDNEAALENFFSDLGFEIAYAEQFKCMREQAGFFSDVSLLASMTGAGLTNMAFMQPGQKILEIVSPLQLGDGNGNLKDETHHFYKTLAMAKNHTYMATSNILRSSSSVIYNLDTMRPWLV
jgi:hypothetical protein